MEGGGGGRERLGVMMGRGDGDRGGKFGAAKPPATLASEIVVEKNKKAIPPFFHEGSRTLRQSQNSRSGEEKNCPGTQSRRRGGGTSGGGIISGGGWVGAGGHIRKSMAVSRKEKKENGCRHREWRISSRTRENPNGRDQKTSGRANLWASWKKNGQQLWEGRLYEKTPGNGDAAEGRHGGDSVSSRLRRISSLPAQSEKKADVSNGACESERSRSGEHDLRSGLACR